MRRIALMGLLLYSSAGLALQSPPAAGSAKQDPLRQARNKQDIEALTRAAEELARTASTRPDRAASHYRLALARHYLAEVHQERGEKELARDAAELGMAPAKKALELAPSTAEYHRMLGALCGQVIPANVLAGLQYGKCALESVNRALELDPKSSPAWLSRGVGNFYLPAALGGGVDTAIGEMRKAVELDAASGDAWTWLGIALRRAKRFEEAREALDHAMKLDPDREWVRLQMAKVLLKQ